VIVVDRWQAARASLGVCLVAIVAPASAAGAEDWPPELKGAEGGTVTSRSEAFLRVPASVAEARGRAGSAAFVVAETPPTVQLAFHRDLGPGARQRRLWSSWGDICVAGDGRVYCGIGDHGDDAGGDARCLIHRWDPARHVLERIVDVNALLPGEGPHPAWSKIHARIDEGPDGGIYFSGTLNAGTRAGLPQYHWDEQLPGGQLYRHDPRTGRTAVIASLPPKRCTATALMDRDRAIWWCNLEAGAGNALWGLSLETGRPVFQAPDGSMGFNRNFALGRDGAVYFNGAEGLWKYDPATRGIARTRSAFPDSPGMRCSTRESRAGEIFGITQATNQLFRYRPARDELELLGPNWLAGSYTAVCVLSPDERYVYYLPGSHGGAFRDGTPVVQYDIASGQRKVLAFLAEPVDRACDYVPGGTYGVKLGADGGTLYVNFNGHASDRIRPAAMRPNGFGLCAFAAIHIPPSER
jgi:hypothetical protein